MENSLHNADNSNEYYDDPLEDIDPELRYALLEKIEAITAWVFSNCGHTAKKAWLYELASLYGDPVKDAKLQEIGAELGDPGYAELSARLVGEYVKQFVPILSAS